MSKSFAQHFSWKRFQIVLDLRSWQPGLLFIYFDTSGCSSFVLCSEITGGDVQYRLTLRGKTYDTSNIFLETKQMFVSQGKLLDVGNVWNWDFCSTSKEESNEPRKYKTRDHRFKRYQGKMSNGKTENIYRNVESAPRDIKPGRSSCAQRWGSPLSLQKLLQAARKVYPRLKWEVRLNTNMNIWEIH